MRIMIPMIASLALVFAAPSSAQIFPRYGYDEQGGGGAGPYDLRCQTFRNYNQRQRCTQALQTGYYGYGFYVPRYAYYPPGYGFYAPRGGYWGPPPGW
jgi:hypothetical protein